MGPFLAPNAVITGFKDKVESLLVQGDRLYIGSATGSLHVYTLDGATATPVEVKTSLSRKAIEQLGYVKDINSLAILSDASLSLYPLPFLAPPTLLSKAKDARSFAIHTCVQHVPLPPHPSEGDFDHAHHPQTMPSVVTYLAVGCYRKVVLYSWRDGDAQELREVSLPHSARTMTFVNDEVVCMGYAPEYAMLNIADLSVIDVALPTAGTSVSGIATGLGKGVGKGLGMGGLGGYIGLGAKSKPTIINVNDGEVLIARDNNGILVGVDGRQTRLSSIEWPAVPDETGFVKPYLLSAFPAGSIPSTSSGTNLSVVPTAAIHVRSSIFSTDEQSQTLSFPFSSTSNIPSPETYQIRALASAPQFKSPLMLVTTSTDRTLAATEGSSIWRLDMKPWGEQIDDLVASKAYAEALALLGSLDQALLPDKDSRIALVRGLHAVSKFAAGEFDVAMDAFIDLDVNPAKVVALYPASVAGRLAVPADEWIPLFGGPAKADDASTRAPSEASRHASDVSKEEGPSTPPRRAETFPSRALSPMGSIRGMGSIGGKMRAGLDALRPQAKDADTASLADRRKPSVKDALTRSVETLLRYLADRRPKVGGALGAFHITPAQAHENESLSRASLEDVFGLPNTPLSALTPDQLVRYAQIVDTALFKAYLVVRPGLIGSLCRVENWCEVTEVEEVLRGREKYHELIDLYHGKKMHGKALELLRSLSERESDPRDKLDPSVLYLQRLGPEYQQLIFDTARWMFAVDPDIAFEVFTSEEAELPRQAVADYLEQINPQTCARFLEFLIQERGEESPMFHNRLAELYLSMTTDAKQRKDEATREAAYAKLLQFIDTTSHYETDRLFTKLPSEDLFEARAILLGRLGRHVHALEIYAYRLQDYVKAEEYCKRIYRPEAPTEGIFLALLRIYLQPTVKTSADLLRPALDLISRHGARLDPVESLHLLPPLVTAQDVRAFLMEALRAPIFDTQVVREVSKARNEQVGRRLVGLQSRRVKVTDTRMCPQCHKRLGNSVIAVHAPRGEVTHYQCREAFSSKLSEMRH